MAKLAAQHGIERSGEIARCPRSAEEDGEVLVDANGNGIDSCVTLESLEVKGKDCKSRSNGGR